MLRLPAVAGQFYPADADALSEMLSELIPSVSPTDKTDAIAAVSPHAGYIYSGGVAGETFAGINIPEDVIILGPNHHGIGPPLALMDKGEWETPLGRVPVNSDLAALLIKHSDVIEADESAHESEHSIEVQVPFLQKLQPSLRITPIVVSRIPVETCLQIGKEIASAIKEYGKSVLILASTDMTHYESRSSATRKDKYALDRILSLDPEGLYDSVMRMKISMCGIIPTTIALSAALDLGATNAELVRYTDSGETSGNENRVVGYAGFIIS
ncbi:MAG: AmmeMemoRadiSam system protein B [Proteobacteria bacterium]|nr:AmmeMemoRadiSam system protein B [Pseudomonadota bacterium]MBU1739233.1 AmmeMemoRadiSam system protein B [Pseudomonadota bacterium]